MCQDFFPGCGHRCSHNASILRCVCTMRPSRTWSTGVIIFYRSLLKAMTNHRYMSIHRFVHLACRRPTMLPRSNGRIATAVARFLGQCIAGWHSAPLWPFECENTRLRCCQKGLHCVLMWLFGHPLLWYVCFICSKSVIIYSYNDKLPVT